MGEIHRNRFKERLLAGERQIGLWVAMGSPTTAEIAAGAGFDWLLIDGEHGPNDLTTVLEQLRAIKAAGGCSIVRPANGDPVMIKQVLDLGARTLLIPMVNTAEQAELMVRSMRYAPRGIRGVGASVARSGDWGRTPHYMRDAERQLCLLVQAESRQALDNLEQIVDVDGVDGVFIGPADLSASLGHPDDMTNPDVQRDIEHAIRTIVAHGKAAGALAFDPRLVRRYLDWGATFIAVAGDTDVFVHGLEREVETYRSMLD